MYRIHVSKLLLMIFPKICFQNSIL